MNAPLAKRTERDGRNLYIDMLRGICILLVMLLHYSLSYHLQVSPLQEWVSIPTLRAIFYNGNYGVDIFFVISGFLITSNTLDRYGSLADVDIAHFYKLRFFRLYPLVIVVLVIITVLGVAGLSNFSNIHRGKNLGDNFFLIADISVLTFWHNMLMEKVGYFNYAMNIYWSLSVEEVFYLLYPLVLLTVRRHWQLGILACLCVVIAPIYRGIHRDDELYFLYGNVACVDMLSYGCVAAIVGRNLNLTKTRRWILAMLTCILGAGIYMQGIQGHEALGATFLGITAALFLIAVSGMSDDGASRHWGNPLAWWGSHSYELYLFHIVVLGIMVELVPKTSMTIEYKLPMLAVFLVLSSAMAWMAARVCGDPVNRLLRRRFVRQHAKRQEVANASGADAVLSSESSH
jgi:peptidoglycan/LPS O-acetylase OafA/YrhL